jgi:hypothetical protein
MRDPGTWDEAYLLSTLPVDEVDWLEVKGSGVFDHEKRDIDREIISKAISAMANSGGGVLVLGLGKNSGSWVVGQGGIPTDFRKPNTREWLEDIVPNLVDLPLPIFNVYSLGAQEPPAAIEPGRAVYVVEVGDSPLAPHQALDRRYYARVAGKSRPIGHRMISDIFSRRRDPIVDVVLRFIFVQSLNRHGLEILLGNTGRVYASYASAFVYVPDYLVYKPDTQGDLVERTTLDGAKYVVFRKCNTARDALQVGVAVPELGPARYEPILPGLGHRGVVMLADDFQEKLTYARNAKIMWKVYADNAPVREGSAMLSEIPHAQT